MDIISFNEAATANGRIEKFIENPDSMSGIVTVPKVIEAGESVTVPAGRVAVLPNVQVDGELVVDGEVFIPSGSGLSTVVQKSGDTMTGNLNFARGTKITGDFSNATHSNRVAFQTSVTNGATSPFFIPNGTGTVGQVVAGSSSDASNTSYISIMANNAAGTTSINSDATGTGTRLPMVFTTGGLERMRIDTAGNVGIGTSSPISKLDVRGVICATTPTSAEHVFKPTRTSEYTKISAVASDYSSLPSWSNTGIIHYGSTATGNFIGSIPNANLGALWSQNLSNMVIGSNSNAPIIFANSSTEKMRIDTAGNLLLTSGTGGLGYGTGAGGTVTQLTSKSTSVTLNKPCGQITMHNESLAAGAHTSFLVNNSLVTYIDNAIVTIVGGASGYSNNRVQATCYDGGIVITVTNQTAGSLSEALVINFTIIKGAIA